MITLLFFIINFIEILSYIPTEFTISKPKESPYLRDTCTCDLTYNVCDRNCCCDPDCDFSRFGFFDDFFEECVESNVILPESVNSVPICAAEHYVIGDLYNPLSVAYQIIKKGMCLNKKEQEFDTNEIKNPEKEINKFEDIKQIDSENMEDTFLQQKVFGDKRTEIIFPVMAPSGMCMEGYIVSLGEDKTVICSIQGNFSTINKRVRTFLKIKKENDSHDVCETTRYRVNDKKEIEKTKNVNNDEIYKRVNIYMINETGSLVCYIDIYLKNYDSKEIISDITFDFKFFNLDSNLIIPVPKKSGNPGYIIGSPIRFGVEKTNQKGKRWIRPFYRNRLLLGLDSGGSCNTDENFFAEEDLILSNIITFENRTLFTCLRETVGIPLKNLLIIKRINEYFNENRISQFGNSIHIDEYINNKCLTDTQLRSTDNYIIVKIFYQFEGLKQNPQRKIISYECKLHSIDNDRAIYIELLFIHQNNQVKIKEVPRPKIITLPHNWLYPFKFGTTDYEEKR